MKHCIEVIIKVNDIWYFIGFCTFASYCLKITRKKYLIVYIFSSIDHPEVTLGSVHDYGLCIAEDDGEVDWAFPCLDNNEPCSKFGFTCLGLIDVKRKENIAHSPYDLNSAFQCFPKASVSGQSHMNSSRQNTGGSDTSEIIKAMNTLTEGKYGIFTIVLVYSKENCNILSMCLFKC